MLLLPMRGKKSAWYKGILVDPNIEIEAAGNKGKVRAKPVQSKKAVDETLEMFRKKYGTGDVKKYYPGQDAAIEVSF